MAAKRTPDKDLSGAEMQQLIEDTLAELHTAMQTVTAVNTHLKKVENHRHG